MDLQNNQNKLKVLLVEMLSPLRNNPNQLINKLLPPEQAKVYYGFLGLIQSPFFAHALPSLKGFDPNQLIVSLVDKLETLSDEFWNELQDCLQGVLDGEPEAIAKAKEILKVV